MSQHFCSKCGKPGEIKLEQGEVRAYLATCEREDCPQATPKWLKELMEKAAQVPPFDASRKW